MPNFSSLAGLEVAEKFVVVGGNTWLLCLTPTLVALELFWVELSYVGFWQLFFEIKTLSNSLKFWDQIINLSVSVSKLIPKSQSYQKLRLGTLSHSLSLNMQNWCVTSLNFSSSLKAIKSWACRYNSMQYILKMILLFLIFTTNHCRKLSSRNTYLRQLPGSVNI